MRSPPEDSSIVSEQSVSQCPHKRDVWICTGLSAEPLSSMQHAIALRHHVVRKLECRSFIRPTTLYEGNGDGAGLKVDAVQGILPTRASGKESVFVEIKFATARPIPLADVP